jgi:hypothetical protein
VAFSGRCSKGIGNAPSVGQLLPSFRLSLIPTEWISFSVATATRKNKSLKKRQKISFDLTKADFFTQVYKTSLF